MHVKEGSSNMPVVKKVLAFYNSLSTGIKYFALSCFVTVIDYCVLFVLYRIFGINLVVANTVGVVTGFLLHYALGSNSVFKTPYGIYGFLVYLSTFLLGLFLANMIIEVSVSLLLIHTSFGKTISMSIGKFLSILLPYFVLYYLRKLLFGLLHKYSKENKTDGTTLIKGAKK